jgi:hypothetical protein
VPRVERISRRALGRATLARQLLLERSDLPVPDVLEHLVGLQAQTPQTWYVGLWSRVRDFDPVALGEALERRELVRIALQRSTLHLVTADDAVALRPVLDPVAHAAAVGARRQLAGVDRASFVAAVRAVVDERPSTPAEIARALAGAFPELDAETIGNGARAWLPIVQVPPRGVWGRTGPARFAALDTWTGLPIPEPAPDAVIGLLRRYLAAFGPATVRDFQVWSGLRGSTELVDRALDHDPGAFRLLTDDEGRTHLDLPDAPRPDEDTPAPVRLLYDFDNLLLSHADRSRVLGAGIAGGHPGYRSHGFGAPSNRQPCTILLDGEAAGTWSVTEQSGGRGRTRRATVELRAFARWPAAARGELESEGAGLLWFLHPEAEPEVVLRDEP